MKTWIIRSLCTLSSFLIAGSSVFAATSNKEPIAEFKYPLKQAAATIQVKGASTLGHWDCRQKGIGGSAMINISAERLREKIAVVLEGDSDESSGEMAWSELNSRIAVTIDAKGFDCDNGRMKRDLVEAIRAEEYPEIKYWFSGVESVSVLQDDDEVPYLELKVRGELLFGGERREVVHTSQLWLGEDTSIQLKGSLNLEMSDFGIKPPTALLGLIRAKNDFQVGYDIIIVEAKTVIAVEPGKKRNLKWN